MILSKFKNNINYIIFFIFSFVFLKLYFLAINPASIGNYTIAVNTHIYFNSKSFYEVASQAFNDWNHPGTPIYFLGSIIGFFIGGLELEKIKIFLIINHIITLSLLIFSIIYFINKTKGFIDQKISISFLLLTFSFDCNFLFLESVDLQGYLIPFILVKLAIFLNCINKNNFYIKDLFKIAFVSSLLLAIKINTIPFVFTTAIYILIHQFNNKEIYNYIKYVSFLFLFFLLFNFPIIGRIPKIFYNILFVRDDTILNFSEISNIIEEIAKIVSFVDFIFVFAIIFILSATLINIFLNYKKNINLSICILLTSFWFIYTFTTTVLAIEDYWFRGVISRHSYFYLYIILLQKNLWKDDNFINIKKYFLIMCFGIFCVKSLNYISDRNDYLNLVAEKEILFKQKLSKYVNKDSKIAVYNNLGYGYSDYSILGASNDVFSSESFTDELNNKFKNLRYLRLNNIERNILNKKDSNLEDLSIANLYEKFDLNLKKYLPHRLYLILSHKSYKLTNPQYFKKEADEIYTENINENKLDIILIGSNKLENKDRLIDFLNMKTGFNPHYFEIKGDPWIILSNN